MINHSIGVKGLPCALSQLLQNGATKLRIGVVTKVDPPSTYRLPFLHNLIDCIHLYTMIVSSTKVQDEIRLRSIIPSYRTQ